MAINEWWAGDNRERFWVEITNRDDLGVNLIAPQRDDAGNEYWSYALVNYVRPGDVVLHWSKQGEPAIVGYSHVAETPFPSSLEWQSRGTYGRNHQSVGEEDAWEASLSGYRQLRTPLTQSIIRASEQSLRDARHDLEATHRGALYFPFALSDLRPVRATQGYLVKFPAVLIDAFGELAEIRQSAVDEPGDQPPRGPRSSRGRGSSGYGRQRDVERRLAVEAFSVDEVKRHYQDELGYRVTNVGSREAWDLTARRGAQELHIEVKGSTMDRLVIDITDGEVRHAEDNRETMLIVIDQIRMDSQLACSGGRWRYWARWVPDRPELIPTAYRHPLPWDAALGKPTE